MKKKYKVWVASGGTFGHIRPALTLTNELENQGISVLFFCSYKDKRFPLIAEREEKDTVFLRMVGLPTNKNPIKWIKCLYQLFYSLCKVGLIVIIARPKKILTAGSFISFPLLFWAKILRIPYDILEQNSVPGIVFRIFAKKANKIYYAMEPIEKKYKNLPQSIITGNPLHLQKVTKAESLIYFNLPADKLQKKFIGISGGSLGAKALVDWVIQNQEEISLTDYDILCITGSHLYNQMKDLRLDRVIFIPFVKNMEYFYTLCDIFISRSGASSISELFYYSKPAVFIPYPYATENHQYFNAQFALKYLKGITLQQEQLQYTQLTNILAQVELDNTTKQSSEHFQQALNGIIKVIKEEL